MVNILINSDDIDATTTISTSELADLRSHLAAMHEFQSIAEYTLDGKIISVNESYIMLTGYTSAELTGQNIGMLLDLKYRHSNDNAMLWTRLNNGNCVSGMFKRIGKGFKTKWIKATYFPVIGLDGKPFKVLEYAIDVTEHVILKQELVNAVRQIQEVVIAVKDGDLTQLIPLEGKDGEIAMLCTDVNSLVECMTAIIRLINNTSASIITAANKVKVANDALSKRWGNHVLNTKDKTSGTE